MSEQETPTNVRNAFVPLMKGSSIDMQNAGALAILSQGDLTMRQGGAQFIAAGGDLDLREGGAQTIVARGDVTIREGGSLLVAGATVDVTDGWVGVALGPNVNLKGSRVLLAPVQALCFGAGFGVAFAVVRRLLRR